MRPGQKKGGTNEKKRGSGTSGSHLFAGGVCSIRSCASGRDSDPDRDFVPGIPRGLPFCLLHRKAAGAFGAAPRSAERRVGKECRAVGRRRRCQKTRPMTAVE